MCHANSNSNQPEKIPAILFIVWCIYIMNFDTLFFLLFHPILWYLFFLCSCFAHPCSELTLDLFAHVNVWQSPCWTVSSILIRNIQWTSSTNKIYRCIALGHFAENCEIYRMKKDTQKISPRSFKHVARTQWAHVTMLHFSSNQTTGHYYWQL